MRQDNDLLKWISGLTVGGGSAAVLQGGSVLTRLASSKMTAGTGNAVVATGEHVTAIGTSLLSLIVPLIIAALIIFLIIFIFLKFGKRLITKGPER